MELIKSVILVLIAADLCYSLVIYRRKPKPKLICKEESEWLMIAQAVDIGSHAESLLANGTYFEVTNSDSQDSSSESREQVKIVPRRLKRSISQPLQHEERTGQISEPVIFINGNPEDMNEFEIVGGELTREEKRLIRQKLMATCNALDID